MPVRCCAPSPWRPTPLRCTRTCTTWRRPRSTPSCGSCATGPRRGGAGGGLGHRGRRLHHRRRPAARIRRGLPAAGARQPQPQPRPGRRRGGRGRDDGGGPAQCGHTGSPGRGAVRRAGARHPRRRTAAARGASRPGPPRPTTLSLEGGLAATVSEPLAPDCVLADGQWWRPFSPCEVTSKALARLLNLTSGPSRSGSRLLAPTSGRPLACSRPAHAYAATTGLGCGRGHLLPLLRAAKPPSDLKSQRSSGRGRVGERVCGQGRQRGTKARLRGCMP